MNSDHQWGIQNPLSEGSASSKCPFHTESSPLLEEVEQAIQRTTRWLLEHQYPDGHWCAELQGDSILESETLLVWAFLGRQRSELAGRLAQYLLETQLPQGGWASFPGGPVNISASVEAYFALKLIGHDPESEPMRRARQAILQHGGADRVNSYTRFFLALFGQVPYDICPAVPPELVLLPRWFPIHLGALSAWTRTIVVPLSIIWACQPIRQLEPEQGVSELFIHPPQQWPRTRCPDLEGRRGWSVWEQLFLSLDRLCKWAQCHRLFLCRQRALKAAEAWMLRRFQGSDGLGAIFPPIVWSLVALRCLGYSDQSPQVRECDRQLHDLMLEDPQTGSVRVQPCKSPVWDTAIAIRAISAAVGPKHPAVARAALWLLERQIPVPGDWADSVQVDPGGWCFEYRNDFYPDNDDTAMVLLALWEQYRAARSVGQGAEDVYPWLADQTPEPFGVATGPGHQRSRLLSQLRLQEAGKKGSVTSSLPAEWAKRKTLTDQAEAEEALAWTAAAITRGLRWMLAMQNRDGGWGAFDRNNNRQFLNYVPFADHNAMLDPSTPDLTGRVLEALGRLGYRLGHPAVDRAVAFLRRSQEPDGAWFGRWGVNYIYGTWQALAGLRAVGLPTTDPAVLRGADWLLGSQQADGGWGESPASYEDPSCRGQGPTTASQTAWAILGLVAAGRAKQTALLRAVRFLLDRQQPDGTWIEQEFTGTGFPRVFYLKYHYYPISFPLLALACWRQAVLAKE
ncbi:MAG: squalene--hopene cyclase [Thermoguttaceae bacterium]|nr:squalene--hopene cyclase [Thermoguttaceae bacterium]MDW8037627.1 prenyltransferase/squalene oxidase repeat-containing protein [Thermoguttaceae bacterium]